MLASPRCPRTGRPHCAAGAVIGREFAVDVLAELAGWSTADAVEHLEEAVRRRVVVRQPSPSGRHRFTHDLFRDTVYDSLTPDQVRTLHLAVGRLLERKRGAGSAVPAAELATHFGAAVAAGDDSDDVIRCAVSYSAEAGHEAVSRLADEDACRHYERALSFATDAPDRTSLLSCLGHARYRCGRADAARRSFDDAGVLAGEHRDSGSLAQAALGWHRVGVRSFSHDRHGVAMIRQALAMIGDEGGPWPPLLLSALARDLHQQLGALDRPADRPEADRAPIPIARRAVSLARRFGDPAVLAAALLALHDALWRPGSARDRLPIVDEMAGLAAACADRELFAQSRQLRAGLLLELGDPDGMQELAEYCRLAEALGHQQARWAAMTRRATLATLRGDLDEAQQLSAAALELGIAIGEPDAYGVTGTKNCVLGRLGGPVVPLEADGGGEGIEAFGRRGETWLRALIALVRGDRDEAERIVSGRSLSGLPSPHDLEMLVFEGWLVGEVGTAEQRRTVYQAMLPYAGTGSVVGGCAAYQGAMDHHLGALALAMGEPAAAAGHLDAALEQYERVGARAWAAAARGERAALGAVRRSPSGSTPIPAGQLNVFRRDGAVWQLTFAGRSVHLPDAKGLRDIATMLAAPGREIDVRTLLGLPSSPIGADAVLDARAKAEYRARIAVLDQELDAADEAGEARRAAAAAAERQRLIHELTAAAGLAGRSRRLGDETERARKTVTARIHHTIGRLADTHPELAEHLRDSVRTGTRCAYLPAKPLTWSL